MLVSRDLGFFFSQNDNKLLGLETWISKSQESYSRPRSEVKTEDSDQEMDEDATAGQTSHVHAKSRFSRIEALNSSKFQSVSVM